jgi:hypothetical protein
VLNIIWALTLFFAVAGASDAAEVCDSHAYMPESQLIPDMIPTVSLFTEDSGRACADSAPHCAPCLLNTALESSPRARHFLPRAAKLAWTPQTPLIDDQSPLPDPPPPRI